MCVVTDKGEAYMWGLENKKSKFRSITIVEPEKQDATNAITKIELNSVVMASCANDYTVFVNDKGKVFSMGDLKVKGVDNIQAKTKNNIIELPLEHITKVSSGINFTMALDDEGRVYVWGSNTYGQLGNGALKNSQEPILVESLLREKIIDISTGDNYSGVVTDKGEVYTWGFGNEGQLGHGDKSDQFLPRKVANLKEKIKTISCGGAHTALLTESGKLLMVGRGREGQLGREQLDESSGGYTLMAK
jgi:RCC1 and BTB domain-containing protein